MRIGALAAMTVLLAVPARAGELAGVTLPDQVTVEGKTLSLNGLGLRQATWLRVNVYVAALYLEAKSSEPEAIIGSEEVKRIVMRFVRGVGRKDIVKAWNESFEENAGDGMAALQDRVPSRPIPPSKPAFWARNEKPPSRAGRDGSIPAHPKAACVSRPEWCSRSWSGRTGSRATRRGR
jgi:Chalcone isomerase-like